MIPYPIVSFIKVIIQVLHVEFEVNRYFYPVS